MADMPKTNRKKSNRGLFFGVMRGRYFFILILLSVI
jgi:hypothetical protein